MKPLRYYSAVAAQLFCLVSPALGAAPGAFYLDSEKKPVPALVLRDRIEQVLAHENKRRSAVKLPLLGEPHVIRSRAEFEGPSTVGPEGTTPWVRMGGPNLHAGPDFLLPEPQLARYNQSILVYLFEGTKMVGTRKFSEFAASRLEEEEILLTRIFFSEDPREANAWRSREWEKIAPVGARANGDVAKSYAHLEGRPLHFGVGGLWANVADKPHVEIRVPKALLMDLARDGLVEFGLTGPSSIPAEVIVLEAAWPRIFRLPTKFAEAQAH